ncbi:MAG: alpha/beta hydrolase domain-containing protein [Ilumatobacteraceae bacterium]
MLVLAALAACSAGRGDGESTATNGATTIGASTVPAAPIAAEVGPTPTGTTTAQPSASIEEITPTTSPASNVANPTVSEASGGQGRASGGLRYDVTEFGYQEHEYVVEGVATTYPPSALPSAPYRTRMIVWTPTDPARFNGTTVVEWAEVSDFGRFELTVELGYLSPLLEDAGYAFALVSAEEGGVCDRDAEGLCTATSLQGADPARYGALEHPGDPYSYDIFSQALQAIKHPDGLAPLGELTADTVIATGFQHVVEKLFPTGAPDPDSVTSPFGIYGPLNAYLANGADADARLVDGFLIDAAAPLTEPAQYRVPVLHHLDESAIRRTPTADTTNHVTWEVVGASHADRWSGAHIVIPSAAGRTSKLGRADELAARDRSDNYGQLPDGDAAVCAPGPRTGSLFPRHYTVNAALIAVHTWIATGIRAPAAPFIERVGPEPTDASEKLTRDADGNAIGGLRAPIIDVPVASYDGEACIQAGTTVSLSSQRLAALYPTHESYVRQLLIAIDQAVDDRFLLCADAERIMRGASASTIGGSDEFRVGPACAAEPAPSSIPSSSTML